MSATLRELIEIAEDWVGDVSDPELTRREINRAIRGLCARYTFDALTQRTTVTLDENSQFTAPPLCRQINDVQDSDEVGVRGARRKSHSDTLMRIFPRIVPAGASTVQTAKVNLTCESDGDSTLTQDDTQDDEDYEIPEGCEGQALRIAGINDTFEILSCVADTSVTVRPKVGESFAGNVGTIGYEGLRLFTVYDTDIELASGTLDIEYQMFHPYLYLDDDRLLPDIRESVCLTAVKTLLRHYKYDVDAQRLENDLERALAAECGAQITARVQQSTRPSTFSVGRGRSWKASRYSR
jgi:hypothetical protein